MEACSLTAWLDGELKATGRPAICIELRQAKAAMGAMPNKTDRNDARAIAQIIRTGWFGAVRKDINVSILAFAPGRAPDRGRRRLGAHDRASARGVMPGEFARLTKQVLDIVRDEPICRRLINAPGVGPLTARALRATIDQPERFRKSRDVGAHLGLTPRRYQSGDGYPGAGQSMRRRTGAHGS